MTVKFGNAHKFDANEWGTVTERKLGDERAASDGELVDSTLLLYFSLKWRIRR